MALRNICSTLIKTDLYSEENATAGAVFGLNTNQSLNRQLSYDYNIESRLTSASDPSAGSIVSPDECFFCGISDIRNRSFESHEVGEML